MPTMKTTMPTSLMHRGAMRRLNPNKFLYILKNVIMFDAMPAPCSSYRLINPLNICWF